MPKPTLPRLLVQPLCAVAGFWLAAAALVTPCAAEQSSWVLTTGSAPSRPAASLGADQSGGQGWVSPAPSRVVNDGALRRVVLARLRPEAALFRGPTLISTGFSGALYQRPILPATAAAAADRVAAQSLPDYHYINLDGVVASLTSIDGFGFAPNGAEVTRPALDRLYAREVGQVFGAVTDDAASPNLYLTATSAYGLNIVGPDRNGDYLPDRLHQGDPQAHWMAGQWGFDPLSGPGSVWKVDGQTGKITLFATIASQGVANAGAGLGNIAFDATHQQLFVSDLQTGLIHRLGLDGTDLDQFDHGIAARSHAGLPPVAMAATPAVQITDFGFDPQDPQTWSLADPLRRVWGLAVQDGRLYYAVASGSAARPAVGPEVWPEVWSVALDAQSGGFTPDARWELSLTAEQPDFEISDMGFAPDGALLLAQRGARVPAFDYSTLTTKGSAEVLRFARTDTAAAATAATAAATAAAPLWQATAERFAVGFADAMTNTTGGLALGPAYDPTGRIDASDCQATLWTSGEALRASTELAPALIAGGMLAVDGAQAQPLALRYGQNAPPWVSYEMDFDAEYPDTPVTGHIGDVAVLGCPQGPASPPPEPKPKPKPLACATSSVSLHCDSQTGLYVADIAVKPQTALPPTAVKLSDPSGQMLSLPVQLGFAKRLSVPVTGLGPGQIGQISICSYDAAAAATGAPYDCCTTRVSFTTPSALCKKVSP